MKTLRYAFVLILLCAGSAFGAGEEAELKRLQGILGTINQELQATYQQYQMAAEARRTNMQAYVYGNLSTPDPQNFETIKQEQRNLVRRDQELTQQMDQILARIRELEARKQPILQRIYQLIEEIAVAVPQPAPALAAPVAEPVAPPRGY